MLPVMIIPLVKLHHVMLKKDAFMKMILIDATTMINVTLIAVMMKLVVLASL
jgi:hypothetical protein